MSVASRLRSVFALYIALLAGVLVYHVRTIQRSVESSQALTEIAARVRATSHVQLSRIAEMSRSAEKYRVTRDWGYLERLAELAVDHGDELLRLGSLELSAGERVRLVPLSDHWRGVEDELWRLADASAALPAVALEVVPRVEAALDGIRAETLQMGEASRTAMARELAESQRAARAAKRVSWIAALGALVLSVLLSALLVRSIVRPLARLAQGTREVSAGRFSHRLEANGSDELAQVAGDFNSMAERLGELDRMKRDFVSNVSHDLKTPLSSMQETTDVLLDGLPGPLSATQRRLLVLNQESGRRLSSMIAKLLDLSRLESEPSRAFEEVDVLRLVRGAVDRASAARVVGGRGGPVTIVAPTEPLLVRADPDGIDRVLGNLLENAIKFSPPNGEVRVTIERAACTDAVLLSVADDGPGIPDADKERVFDRFYQTEAGRAVRSRGVGLGLSISLHIVAAHGGAIWVTDHAPHGTVAWILLPGVVNALPQSVHEAPPLAESAV